MAFVSGVIVCIICIVVSSNKIASKIIDIDKKTHSCADYAIWIKFPDTLANKISKSNLRPEDL
jgi:hypothetical protein